jgi:hypothetical protein
VSDLASNVSGLTAAAITALPGTGVSGVTVTDANNLTLNEAQVAAFESSKVALSIQNGEQVILSDSAANIKKLTAVQIAGLTALHITLIQATDTNVALTSAQAKALETAAVKVTAPSGSHVTVADTSGNLQALTAQQVTGLAAIGVSGLGSTNGALRFTVAQTLALEGGLLVVTPFTGTAVTLSDTGTNIATLSAAQISSLGATGFTALTSTSGGVALNVSMALALEGVKLKIAVQGGSRATITDTAANIAALSASQLAALSATGVSGITADGSVTLTLAQAAALASPAIKITPPTGSVVAVSDIAAVIGALTTAQIAGLKAVGVTALSASDASVRLTVAQAAALETAGIGLSPPSGGQASVTDTAVSLQTLTAAQIAGLAKLHVTQLVASNTGVALTVAQAAALETAAIPVTAPSGSHVTISDTAAHLQALTTTQIASLSGIGVTGLNSTGNVVYNASLTSAIVTANLALSATGTARVSETFTNNAVIISASNGTGGGSLTLSNNSNGVTVNVGPSALSVTAGTETIPLSSYATETITATGRTSDTFEFAPHFGNDTIAGLLLGSLATHDILEFNASAFGTGLTAANQAADMAALLLNTVNNSAGNAVISDVYGDTLTLGVSKATLSLPVNAVDFKFV